MPEGWRRIRAIVWKDAAEVASQPGLLLPAAAMAIGLALPAFIPIVVVPWLSGESLADAGFAVAEDASVALAPGLGRLAPESRAQAFLLQPFLLFSLIVPVLGSLSLAAQGIIGEKQARSLEPLLATPITTAELLLAKVLTPFVLSMALLGGTFLVYLAGLGLFAEPDVWRTLFWPRTLVLFLLLGPLVSLTALMMAAIISSRVNDARTAQQLGGFVALPLAALFIAQLTGQFLLGSGALIAAALVLALALVPLAWVGVRLFDRETILVRWK